MNTPPGPATPELVGRTEQLATLIAAIEAAKGGRGDAIVVLGEPGVGKTSLVEAAVRESAGIRRLHARGVASESVMPFAGLQQLAYPVRTLIDRLPAPQADALRAAIGMAPQREADPYLLALALVSLLSEAAADGPVVVTVDDIPWLDPASREAILFLARRVTTEPVTVIVAARTDDWRDIGDPGLRQLELRPLDEAALTELVASRTRTRPHQEVVRRLASASGGNPLAVVEVTANLSADQLVGRTPLPARLPITDGLERAFEAGLAELAPELSAALLLVAAEEGSRRDVLDRAARSLDMRPDVIEDGLRLRYLVERDGRVDFRHPIIRSAVYARADAPDRRRAHAALAEAFADADPDRAVWHRAAAVDGPDAEASSQLAMLAERTRSRGAPLEAMAAWERAAELAVDPAYRAGALLSAAEVAAAAGRMERALGLLDGAERLPLDDEQRTQAAWLRGGIELAAGDARRAYRRLVEAADSCVSADPVRALHILNVAAEAASLANDRDATADLARHAPAPERDRSARAQLLHAALLGFAADFAGDVEAAAGHLRRAVALAADVDDAASRLVAGRAAIYVGDDEAARDLHRAVIDDARRRGAVDLIPIAAPRLATAEMLLGRWTSAAATAEESSRLADETGQIPLAPHGRTTLAVIAAMRGDAAESARRIDEALGSVGDRSVGLIEDDAHWARGLLALGAGQAAEAFEHFGRITHPVVQLLSSLDRSEAAAACTDADRTREWMAPVIPLATPYGPSWARARVRYAEALSAEPAGEAESLFATAVEEASRSSRPFERARIELGAGSFLRRHRRRIDARTLLRRAAATFDLLGAKPWFERAQAELRASGETLATGERRALDRLTPQELQVARAVAEGRSNKEVAAHLFLSPRTVEFHLRNVFAKLDITSRAQLARLDLEDPTASP